MQARALHYNVHVLDLEKSIAFYEDALGLRVVNEMGPENNSWKIVYLADDMAGFQLELTWNDGRTEPYMNGSYDTHIAFAVDDLDAALEHHQRMGCVERVNERMGIYFISDPDGCWIEIIPNKPLTNGAQTGVDVLYAMRKRRSVRSYTGEEIPAESLQRVVEAGLLSASGRAKRPWELVVVRDKDALEALSKCREAGSQMLASADAAIVVVADHENSDTWIEDCSIVMANMHLEADALGLGSCWIQIRMRNATDGSPSQDCVRELLGIPDQFAVEAILSLGVVSEFAEPRLLDDKRMAKVHWEKF